MSNDLGKKIKIQRLRLDLSLRKVCETVVNDDGRPISVSYLNDIEQGYRNPNNKIIVQLADTLKLKPEDLLNIAKKIHPDVENAVTEQSEVGSLFRRLAEKIKNDPGTIEWLNSELDKKE